MEDQTVLATPKNMGCMALLIYIHTNSAYRISVGKTCKIDYHALICLVVTKIYRVMKSNQVTTWKRREHLEKLKFTYQFT